METKLKVKGTRRVFESKIIALFGVQNLEANRVNEEGVNLILYYDKTRDPLKSHVGTWQRGGGWMYDNNKKELVN